jgi:protein-disulfide isomerase
MKRLLPFLIVGLVAAATIVSGTMLYRAKKPAALRSDSAGPNESGHVRGNAKAAITLEEFGDYQCPPCGKIAEPLRELERTYGDKLRLVFHQFPLIMHLHAREAACAAEAAALQGKFWEMHDLLYREQAAWSKATDARALFIVYAGMIGLDVARFRIDIDSQSVKNSIDADIAAGSKIGVTSTPTIFVNSVRVPFATGDPVKPVRDAIDQALQGKPSGG